MNKSAELAIANAASNGVAPMVFTETEGADWSSNPIETATHIHSIVFDNEQRWDEVNGWNLYVTGQYYYLADFLRLRATKGGAA